MTEQQNVHRYPDSDGYEQTSVLPPYDPQAGSTGPSTPPPGSHPSVEHGGRGRRGSIAILLAALLLGGAGGVAGAAGYVAATDEPATTTEPTAEDVSTGRTLAPLESGDEGSEDDTPAPEGSAEAVAAAVLPAVVKINVLGSGGLSGSGSGVVISEDGEILTNDHVVEPAGEDGRLSVSFTDGTTAEAQVIGTDPVTDLAVIQVEGVEGLEPARIGSSEKLDVGEGVVAIGSPFGLEATVTEGIVSSLNRPVAVGGSRGNATIYPAIQTDAAINPGNSGGPLVNLAGEVVGINSSIRTSSGSLGEGGSIGLGFAIPISKVLPIVEQLRAGEQPTHAMLGVTVSSETGEDGLVIGAGIESVEPGSAAEQAGVEVGDVVTRVDDEAITGTESLVATIRGYRPGDEVQLTVSRDGETVTLDATLDSDAEGSDG